jgi:hypothetical protein
MVEIRDSALSHWTPQRSIRREAHPVDPTTPFPLGITVLDRRLVEEFAQERSLKPTLKHLLHITQKGPDEFTRPGSKPFIFI